MFKIAKAKWELSFEPAPGLSQIIRVLLTSIEAARKVIAGTFTGNIEDLISSKILLKQAK